MDFTVEYRLAPDEAARALEQGIKHQYKLFRLGLPAVLAVSGVVCLLVGTIPLGIGLLVGAVVPTPVMSRSTRLLARRQLAFLCVPTMLRMTSDGYEYRTEHMSGTAQWSLFTEVQSTSEFWLFYVNRQCTAFLPRSAFDSAQQAELDALFAARQGLAVRS